MKNNRRLRWSVVLVAFTLMGASALYVFRPYDRAKLMPPAGPSWTRLGDVSPHVVEAFISAEDRNFHSHRGVDATGIARGLWLTIRGRRIHGGSTITMQTVKMIEPQPRSLRRHLRNYVLAVRLERVATKDEILEQYLNRIYFANGVYGIGDAAERYFDKEPADLSLAEAALLAGMAKAPSVYDPETNTTAAIARRDQVLALVEKNGYASAAEVAAAQSESYTPR